MYELMRTSFLRLKRDNRGVTAVEYAVIAAVMAAALIGAFTAFSGGLSGAISSITL
jgi:Flp pilus assembly pilin Flp